ncbi:integrase [Duganella sp. 1224]|uniref:site-specific integrase n=1 Tax=Duganella sp. 1224 TaxID=2587052 RepID=UPI0015CA3975|nr:site-specific integrase [Duganella sp. 1224]NYE61997.1 integrase [Duganella sp. 1224]
MATKKIQNERVVERNITIRCDGFSYRVRMMVNGTRIDETFDTVQEARAYRDRLRADAATDPAYKLVLEAKQRKETAAKLTLEALLDRYLAEITPTKRGARAEISKIGKLKRYPIARLPINLVRREAVLQFMETAKSERWSDSSLRKYLMLISSLFQVATKRWGMSLDNPIRSVEVPTNGKGRDRRLEAGEFERLLAELKKARNRYVAPVFELAVETACRQGEILKLQHKDIDFSNAIATLRYTKNGDDRIIPLSTRAVAILAQVPIPIKGALFQVTEVELRRAFNAAKQRAQKRYLSECAAHGHQAQPGYLADLRFHDLRHEATSRLFEKGLNLMEVASITGHKTLAMLKRYTHLRATDLAKKLG